MQRLELLWKSHLHPEIRRSSREHSIPSHVEWSLLEVVDGDTGDSPDVAHWLSEAKRGAPPQERDGPNLRTWSHAPELTRLQREVERDYSD